MGTILATVYAYILQWEKRKLEFCQADGAQIVLRWAGQNQTPGDLTVLFQVDFAWFLWRSEGEFCTVISILVVLGWNLLTA